MCVFCTQQYYYDDDDDNIYVYDCMCVCICLAYVIFLQILNHIFLMWERWYAKAKKHTTSNQKGKAISSFNLFGGIWSLCVCVWVNFYDFVASLLWEPWTFIILWYLSLLSVFYVFYTKSHINDEEIKRFRMNYVSKDSCPP